MSGAADRVTRQRQLRDKLKKIDKRHEKEKLRIFFFCELEGVCAAPPLSVTIRVSAIVRSRSQFAP
jgi:hypothetical protein